MNMRMKSNVASALLMIFAVAALAGCSGGNGGGNNSDFFTVVTLFSVNGFAKPDPNVGVNGAAAGASFNCTQFPNGVSTFNGATDGNGQFTVANAALGGNGCAWNILRAASANCPVTSSANVFVTFPGQTVNLGCSAPGAATFTASPENMNPSKPPSTMTFLGANFTVAYGMPQVTFYDVNQSVLLTVTAISVSADGTSLTIPATQVTFADGGYGAVIYSKQADGTWNPLGGAAVNLFTPSGPPPRCKPPMPCC